MQGRRAQAPGIVCWPLAAVFALMYPDCDWLRDMTFVEVCWILSILAVEVWTGKRLYPGTSLPCRSSCFQLLGTQVALSRFHITLKLVL